MMAAHARNKDVDWRRQQSCPVIHTDEVEARERAGVNRLVGRAMAQSARPAPATKPVVKPVVKPKRAPMPSPRSPSQEDCVYLTEREVHSPTLKKRPPPLSFRPSGPPLQSPSACEASRSKSLDSRSHYYKTLSEDIEDVDQHMSSSGYDYTRFYSGPRSGNGEKYEDAYHMIGETSGQRRAPIGEPGQVDDPCPYDYTRFPAAHSASPRANARSTAAVYRELEADGSDEDDAEYSEPRNLMAVSEPPAFAAPSLPKSRSLHTMYSSTTPQSPTLPPKSRLKKYQSEVMPVSVRPASAQGRPKPKPRGSPPAKLSPKPSMKPTPRRHSPLTPKQLDSDEDPAENPEEYDYPSVDRLALPYFRPKPVNPGPGRKTFSNPALPVVAQDRSSRKSHSAPSEQEVCCSDDGAYVYNEPSDTFIKPPLPGEEGLYDPGVPAKLKRAAKPSKPPPAPRPSGSSKPNSFREKDNSSQKWRQMSAGEASDDEETEGYYDPPIALQSPPVSRVLILDDEPTPWYHGTLSRTEAEKLLAPHQSGTYLLRDGQKHRGYTLSVSRSEGQCRHFQVSQRDDGTFKLGSFVDTHKSVHTMILFCHQNSINSAGEKLVKPLSIA